MKRILIYTFFFLLIGCQRQDDVSVGNGNELSFKVAVEGEQQVETRSYAGDVDINTVGFGLVGYKTLGGFMTDPSVAVPNVLSSSETLKSQGNVAWIMPDISAPVKKFKIKLPTVGGSSTVDDGETISYFAWSGDKSNGLLKTTAEGNKGFPFLDVAVLRADEVQKDVVATHALDFPNEYVVTSIDLDFHHIFSKMTFSVNNKTSHSIKIKSSRLSFASNKVYSKARYNYNCSDSIGVFASYANYYSTGYFTPTGWNVPSVDVNAKQLLGTMLLMPQPTSDGFLTVELVYTITSGATTTDVTRVIPLKALALSQGKNYMYTFNIHAEEIEVIQASVGAWNEAPTGSLPLVPGPCGDDILLLDGNDAPYSYDGKLYWLDRSGYNNHCEIIITEPDGVTHSEADKGYKFKHSGASAGYPGGKLQSYIKIPDLSTLTNTTVEMVVTPAINVATTGYTTPFALSRDDISATNIAPGWADGPSRDWLVAIAPDYAIIFDYGGGRYSSDTERATSDKTFDNYRTTKAFYAFRRGSSIKTMSINDGYLFSAHSIADDAQRASNTSTKMITVKSGAIGALFDGGIVHYLKITNKCLSVYETTEDFKALKQDDAFKIPEYKYTGGYPNYLPAVRAGLRLCLNSKGPITNVWFDLSEYYTVFSVYRGAIKEGAPVKFNGSTILKLESTLGKHQELTLEAVARPQSGNENTFISFNPEGGSFQEESKRQLHVHLPWQSNITFNSPYDEHSLSLSYGKIYDAVHHYCFEREVKGSKVYLRIYIDGSDTPNAVKEWPSVTSLEEMANCYIGGQNAWGTGPNQFFTGDVYAIRVYSRALSKEERKANYDSDKTAFGF